MQASIILHIIYNLKILKYLTVNSLTKYDNFLYLTIMKPVPYYKLYEELLEQYPIEANPEIYSLYTSMLQHLMKCFKLKHSTAVKLLLKIEEKLGIHLVRDRELTNMKMLKLKKNEDVKRYFRTIYWYNKLPIDTVDAIIRKYNNISASIVKKFLLEKGQLTSEKFDKFTYSQKYYKEHKQELKEKKREYRARKKKEREIL